MLYIEIQAFLEHYGIEYQHKKTEDSPFVFLCCPGFGLKIHCIQLAVFQKNTLAHTFFQELSAKHHSLGIKVIHLWEDVWRAKTDLVKSRLLTLFGVSNRIHARLCEARKIDQETLNKFLTNNHLQESTKAKYRYGLYIEAKRFGPKTGAENQVEYLVGVASFGALRPMPTKGLNYISAELIRFANLQGHTVVGGLGKLLKAFERDQHPNDIMTYADADWSSGESYQKLGFAFQNHAAPNFFWLNTSQNQRVHVQKTTEHEPPEKLLIWNAGSFKFVKTLNP